jgi:hypothetical protein
VTDTWSWSNARPEIATDENVECFTCLRRFPIAPVPPRPNGFHAAKAAIAAARGRGVQDQAALQAAAGKEIPSR